MGKYLHGLFCVALAGVLAGATFWGLYARSQSRAEAYPLPYPGAVIGKFGVTLGTGEYVIEVRPATGGGYPKEPTKGKE